MSQPPATPTHPTWRRMLPHLNGLYRFAWCLSGSREQAEGLVEETVVSTADPGTRLPPALSSRAGLFATLRTRFYRDQPGGGALGGGASGVSAVMTPSYRRGRRRRVAHWGRLSPTDVLAMLHRMPPPWREILYLRDVESMTYEDLCMIVGAPESEIRRELMQAREALRRWLHALDRDRDALPSSDERTTSAPRAESD